MHLEGRTEIAAPRQRVWETVVDPRQVAACVPGGPEVEVVDERHVRCRVSVGAGFFRTTAVIDIGLTDLEPPSHATATGSGSAMGGSAVATAQIQLDEAGPALTTVAWAADITLGGMLSGFAGMAEAPARDGIDRTMRCLKAKLEAAEAARPS